MASFAAMMQMSHAQTAQKQAAVEAMAAERKRKEQETKKRQLEQEKKRREEEAKLRQKHFEDQKKEAEREKQKEERRRAVEAERQKREDAQRDALLGKKASSSSKYPSSASHSRARDEVRKTRLPSEEDEDGSPRGEVLTRQEIRERKLQQRLKREFGTKRSTITAGYQRHGRRLPGGAVDVTVTNRLQVSDSGSGNVKQRLSALPNTLQPLNQNKRDTRTIDEIVTQLHANKKKTIEGEDAKVFDDWFGNKKKEQPQSRMGSSAPASGSNTPRSSQANGSSTPVSSSAMQRSSALTKPIPKVTPSAKASAFRASSADRGRSDKISNSNVKGKGKLSNGSRPSSAGPSTSRVPAKRSRSPTRSESPHSKRRVTYDEYDSEDLDDEDEELYGGKGGTSGYDIYQIMGLDRKRYMEKDVFSDDEDMEADADSVWQEEQRSARIAKREDQIALEEEKRRELDKKRRKKEREQY